MALSESASLVAFAFTAGALTFFAPCAYPLLPGYVSFYLGRTTDHGGAEASTESSVTDRSSGLARATVVGAVGSVGFVLVYGVLGGVAAVVGTRLLAGISVLELVVGVLLVGMGLAMLAGVSVPTPTVRLPRRERSITGYFAFGVLYAAAAAGCSAPVFVGVLLEALSRDLGVGAVVVGAYVAGMSLLLVAVTVATALGRDALLTRWSGRTGLLHRAAGGLLVLAGVVQIYLFLFRFGGMELLGL